MAGPFRWIAAAALAVALAVGIALRPSGPRSETPAGVRPPATSSASGAPASSAPSSASSAPSSTSSPPPPASSSSPPASSSSPPASSLPSALPPDHPPIAGGESAAGSSQVSLQWLGHSCFYIHSPGGIAVVLDPFDPRATGLPAPEVGAHLVAISRDGPEHAYERAVRAFPNDTRRVLRGGAGRAAGAPGSAPAARGDVRLFPAPLGAGNTAWVVEAGPLRIAHLGAPAGPPAPAALRALGRVDVLLLPVGGRLSPAEAVAICREVAPRVVVPMGPPDPESGSRRPRGLEAFVAASPYARVRKEADVLLLSPAELPPETEIWELPFGP